MWRVFGYPENVNKSVTKMPKALSNSLLDVSSPLTLASKMSLFCSAKHICVHFPHNFLLGVSRTKRGFKISTNFGLCNRLFWQTWIIISHETKHVLLTFFQMGWSYKGKDQVSNPYDMFFVTLAWVTSHQCLLLKCIFIWKGFYCYCLYPFFRSCHERR